MDGAARVPDLPRSERCIAVQRLSKSGIPGRSVCPDSGLLSGSRIEECGCRYVSRRFHIECGSALAAGKVMASSVWRGRISFGLVSIPVRLVKAARRERTRFRRVQKVPASEPPDVDFPDEDEASAPP